MKDTFGDDPRLHGFDIERLIRRAEEQRVTLESYRLKAAHIAFEASPSGP